MPLFEDNTHVFIVRIWLERRELEDAPAEWRGMIEHVASRERRYFNELKNIPAFIVPYLEYSGVNFGMGRRINQWLQLLGAYFYRR